MLSEMTENTVGWNEFDDETKFVDQDLHSLVSDSYGETGRESQQTFLTTDISKASQETFNALVLNMDIKAYPISVLYPELDDLFYKQLIDGHTIQIDGTSDDMAHNESLIDRKQISVEHHNATNSYIHKDILGFENIIESKSSSAQ